MSKAISKRAIRNIKRRPGKSILLGITIAVIAVMTMLALSIRTGTENSITQARLSLGSEVNLRINMQKIMEDIQKSRQESQPGTQPNAGTINIPVLTEGSSKAYENSQYVKNINYNVTGQAAVKLDTIQVDTEQGQFVWGNQGNSTSEYKPISIIGDSNVNYAKGFNGSNKQIIEGNFYSADDIANSEKVILIDKNLADFNNLKVGDMVDIFISSVMRPQRPDQQNNDKSQDVTTSVTATTTSETTSALFKIIGIFTEQQQQESSDVMAGNVSSNTIYMPYSTARAYISSWFGRRMQDASEVQEQPTDIVSSISFQLIDSEAIDAFKAETINNGFDESIYTLDAGDSQFDKMIQPMQNLSKLSTVSLVVVLAAGVVIMVLLLTLMTLERKNEIGIMRSLGAKKMLVVSQFLTETLVVCIIALVIGGFIGASTSGKVGEYLLGQQVQSMTDRTQSTTNNMGNIETRTNRNQNRPGFGNVFNLQAGNQQNVEYLKSLEINIGWLQIVELLGIGLGLCMIGCIASSYVVMKYEPMTILASRN